MTVVADSGSQDGSADDGPAEESHADIWAAMPTTVIRDCSARASAVVVETSQSGPQVSGQLCVDSDDDETSSSSSGSSDDDAGAIEGPAAPSSASTAGPPMGESEEVTLQELLGGDATELDGLDADLPTVEQERRRLEALALRRRAVEAIASRYTPILRPGDGPRDASFCPPPREVLGQAASQSLEIAPASGQESVAFRDGWTIGSSSRPQTSAPRAAELVVPSSEPSLTEELAFTSLEALSEDTVVEPQGAAARTEATAATKAAQYAVADSPTGASSMDLQPSLPASAEDQLEKASVEVAPEKEQAKSRRPWDPADGPKLGPRAAPPSGREASFMLRRLGDRFREHGLAQGGLRAEDGGAAEVSHIINALGSRLGDFPVPTVASGGAISSRTQVPNAGAKDTSSAAPGHRVGDRVVLKGLSKTELNGKFGVVTRAKGSVPAGRLPVRLLGQETSILVKLENLDVAPPVEEQEEVPRDRVPDQVVEPAQDTSQAVARPEVEPSERSITKDAAWPVSEKKFSEGLQRDAQVKEELWHQFLAGDDRPVGGDALPPPDVFYANANMD